MDPSSLETLWFVLIAVLWAGYLFLEGFDFGVGMLMPALARDDVDRRVMLRTIGPVWDGNEVWLLTAGGATFAAFPEWYATLFSGFYLPLLLILLALIGRNVALEFRDKHDDPGWRRTWDAVIIAGSVVPALLWGVAFANLVRGVTLAPDGEYAGSFADLLNPYALLGGVLTLVLCLAHGAAFLSLRTEGEVTGRARRAARLLTPAALVVGGGFVAWTFARSADRGELDALPLALGIAAAVAVAAATIGAWRGRDGVAFLATGASLVLLVATVFAELWPNVIASSGDPDLALSIAEAASSSYTLGVMTVVAVVLTPVVLLYQGWTYWVFRRRIGRADFPPSPSPMDMLGRRPGASAGDG